MNFEGELVISPSRHMLNISCKKVACVPANTEPLRSAISKYALEKTLDIVFLALKKNPVLHSVALGLETSLNI